MALVTGFLAPPPPPPPQRQLLQKPTEFLFPSLDLKTVPVPLRGCSDMNYKTHQSPLHKYTLKHCLCIMSANQCFPRESSSAREEVTFYSLNRTLAACSKRGDTLVCTNTHWKHTCSHGLEPQMSWTWSRRSSAVLVRSVSDTLW